MKIGLIGRGFVGDALYKSFESRGQAVSSFDKYKKIGRIEDIEGSDLIFLCLPTPFVKNKGFDMSSLNEACHSLSLRNFSGLIVVKSTVEPGSCKKLSDKYSLNICHNPEFLTARTNYKDFENQKHIVLGSVRESESFDKLVILYKKLYPSSHISICSAIESESMKIFCNSFYAVKVQFFNELYILCNKLNIDYENVKSIMLKNNWINPMHTMVPGPDGQLSYGGACFPKDTMALEKFMVDNDLPHQVLSATIKEREAYRDD